MSERLQRGTGKLSALTPLRCGANDDKSARNTVNAAAGGIRPPDAAQIKGTPVNQLLLCAVVT